MPECEPLRPFGAGDLGQRVDLLCTDASRDPQAADDAAGVERLAKDLEFRCAEDRRKLLDLEPVTQVRLVDAVAAHRFLVGDAADRRRHGDIENFLPDVGEAALDDVEHIVLVDERHFEVQLRELRLAIGALVFVPVAADDLEIAIHAGHHEQLLVELGRLRQRIHVTRLQPAGDQEVASALWRAADQHGGFDLEEPFAVEEIADRFCHPMPQLQVAGHPRPAQVQVAIAKADLLIDRTVFIDGEGGWLCAVQNGNGARLDLHFTGRKLLVFGSWRAPLDGALYVDHPFRPKLAAGRVRLGLHRVELHLDDSASITQVDEDQTTQVAPPMHPAVDVHLASDLIGSNRAGGRAWGQAHAPPNIWPIVDSRSRYATLVWVFSCISRITT